MLNRRIAMTKADFFSWLLIFSFASSGCSIEISQTPPVTLAPQTATVAPTSISHPQAMQSNGTPPALLSTTKIAVTWANLNLTGRLVYLDGDLEDNTFTVDIKALDLVTGVTTTIFTGPKDSYIYYATVSPDNKQLIMSYIAPPTNGAPSMPLLYLLPLDGSQPPQLLFA